MGYRSQHVSRLRASVGICGINSTGDVQELQTMINSAGYHAATGRSVPVTGICSPETIQAIQWYQRLLFMSPSGLISPADLNFFKVLENASISRRLKPRTTGPLHVRNGQVTFDAEGVDYLTAIEPFKQKNYPYFSRVLHWPKGQSGVTLGRGYDMKRRSAGEIFSTLRQSGIEEYKAAIISRAAYLHGNQAKEFVDFFGPLVGEITHLQQIRLFEISYKEQVDYAKGVYQRQSRSVSSPVDWDHIDPVIKDVFVDSIFQGNATAAKLVNIIANRGSKEDVAEYFKTDSRQANDPLRKAIRLRRLED
ncbi:peptidoglycan-binding protein [Pluralibacter gergoviae]|uniref:peptidoglycan-binding protein n=1 Tax=Pluralibacter gergoviae TaxID=61647 RepID=UPI0006AC7FF2|nr:peptidoglycan-binding protein [Pluralibacter gergoviae]EKW6619861.1 peptidoglycan-binding protein [Pluralibacter gergoviae]KOR00406.1 hypothetical protein ABW48_09185 [Pluralibacter gergoviae]OHY68267.1 hypothetical protein BB778_13810 [Pluralibacter gergoviae]